MFKLWPWLEANKNRLIGAVTVVVVAAALYSFISWRHDQNEMAAGQAMTQLLVSAPGATAEQSAPAFVKLAADYAGTAAARRAQLQAAATYFSAGKYADAQAQFQKVLDASAAGALAPTAAFGVASSLEAQGKLDDAAAAYRKVATQFADSAAALPAKFALGRIAEQQGKFAEAMSAYQELARNNFAGSLASEAALRAIEIKSKIPAAPKAAVQPVLPTTK